MSRTRRPPAAPPALPGHPVAPAEPTADPAPFAGDPHRQEPRP
ncbi:hypothetical protein ACEZCY_27370 [Streptacidiphilus sp. N1-12]|uniref:Uncharacterized protein n=2 Tax=Streptacidiphilus alkalitolerans TaxID=3342712 RepID=A0ABV6WLJ0_9ACTN